MPPSPPPPATPHDPRLSPSITVVIPALNEEDNLPLVLEGLPPIDEVVIVDGGSADDTVAIAREVRPDAVVVRQTRTGKGNALACGFAASRGDIVVTLNADGSTDPGELPRFVDALVSGAEMAHGPRFLDSGADLGGRRLDRFGNAVLSWIVNALFGTRFTDIGFGYNAYWRALVPALDLPPIDAPRGRRDRRQWGDGAEIEPLLNIRSAAQGLRVVEVASIGYPPINGARERRRLRRALRALRTAFVEYVRRRRFGRRPDPAGGALPGTASRRPETLAPRTGGEVGGTRTRLRRRTDGSMYDTGTPLAAGPWQDLTGTAQPEPADARRYDPAARRSLPLYPPPDPAWTSPPGRHAAPGAQSAAISRGTGGAHHRAEPDPEPRDVGGGRRRLEAGVPGDHSAR